MRFNRWWTLAIVCAVCLPAYGDPCGMVPPIYQGPGSPITRVGDQQTYVLFKDGVETFVIRPGFSGKVDEFGMLIPFPSPPALRKVPDHIFPHLAAAIDPPEVVVDLRPKPQAAAFGGGSGLGNAKRSLQFRRKADKDEVRVLKQEAVGMYEVAVLEAGSAAALKKWMDQHGYKYPKGMDKVCDEYVEEGWCFVAVKTKVGQKQGADPQPGQRRVDTNLPKGSVFDGYVQAMGFRFKTDKLVVPMRLSAFNEGRLDNVVYIVTDGPKKIRSIPEEYVVRQISGKDLHRNVTGPLPLRILGGTEKDLNDWWRKRLPQMRDPEPKNGAAKVLLASDLLAMETESLSLPHEEREKELLRIGEHFGLRGAEIDRLNGEELAKSRQQTVEAGIAKVKELTLTVIDGDFPREVLAARNLTFAEYQMRGFLNTPKIYDAKRKGPAPKQEGVLILGQLAPAEEADTVGGLSGWYPSWLPFGLAGLLAAMGIFVLRRQP